MSGLEFEEEMVNGIMRLEHSQCIQRLRGPGRRWVLGIGTVTGKGWCVMCSMQLGWSSAAAVDVGGQLA